MKFYKCDECKEEYVTRKIILIGFSPSEGDILLPEWRGGRRKDFCSRNCLLTWTSKEKKDG